jgi:hypothetical protein
MKILLKMVSWTKKSFPVEFHICKTGKWDLNSENSDLVSAVKELFYLSLWDIVF